MKLGVFDSGIGGEAVAASLRESFPEANILVVNDHDNVPYGAKTMAQICTLTEAAIQPLLEARCDNIVIACNSATAAAIEYLRQRYPSQQFIGFEPMVKPAAALTETGIIAVCATPATLASQRYHRLIETYAQHIKIIEPDCSTWASMIEHDTVDTARIKQVVSSCTEAGADVIVLACTHYHWIKELIAELAGAHVTILEPSEAIARRVRQLTGSPVSATEHSRKAPASALATDPTTVEESA